MPLCDYGCGQEAVHQYKNGKWCCSTHFKNCPGIINKVKLTCLKKYGVSHPMHSLHILNKLKEKCIEKYGVDNPNKSPEIIEKRNKTNLIKYGNKCSLNNAEVREKRKQTWIKNYNTDHPFKNSEVNEKIRKTMVRKYGVENAGFSKELIEKQEKTMIERYGVKRPLQYKEFKKKQKQTTLDKFGVENASKNQDIIKRLRLIKIDEINQRLKNGQQLCPNFNPIGCQLIDEYGKQNGYNFKHAMNGGEYRLTELGYWVDGYDSEKNTVIEINEPFHYNSDGNLSERDINRRKEIIEHLRCDFIIVKVDNKNNIEDVTVLKSTDLN